MENIPQQARLFTLRIWLPTGDAASEWRARLQDVRSGEVTYCADWDSLIVCIKEMLREQGDNSQPD